MASQWTNKYAILRDLSFAQGRKVPAEIVGSVAIGEKPPVTNVKGEAEEEYIQNGGDGELHTKPDLFLIKHMLDLVNEVDVVSDDDTDKLVQISKLNPSCGEFVLRTETNNDTFVPKNEDSAANISTAVSNNVEYIYKSGTPSARNVGSGDNNGTKEISSNNDKISDELKSNNSVPTLPKKKRRERNAVLIALLEKEELSLKDNLVESENTTVTKTNKAIENTETTSKDECKEVKLLKPNDFMIQVNDSDLTVTHAVKKVTEWLQTPVDHQSTKMKPITVPPSNMFKKKKPLNPVLESGSMFKRKSDTSSIKSSDSDPGRNLSNNTFVPSTQANEYYKKYVERSQVQKTLQEDIWEKAQRVMKEIDAKRFKKKEDKTVEHLAQTITSTQPIVVNTETVGVNSEAESSSRQEDNSKPEDTNTEESGKNKSSPPASAGLQGLDLVRLPQHRHELPEECKVCLVLAKYRPSQPSDSLLRF